MSKYFLKLRHLDYNNKSFRWCLDFPKDELFLTYEGLINDGVLFQGWVLSLCDKKTRPYLKGKDFFEFIDLNLNRKDVIQAILGTSEEGHLKRLCGFSFILKFQQPSFTFGVEIEGRFIDLIEVHVNSTYQVIQGKDGWLFLDNDTNMSVDQFKGKLPLSSDSKIAWRDFFDNSLLISQRFNSEFALLIAPSKEVVFFEKYPFLPSKSMTISEVIKLIPANYPLVYPVDELRCAALRSFRVKDTHWSPYGAYIASCLVAEKLGYSKEKISAIFIRDTYRIRNVAGDLGNKLFPPEHSDEALLANFTYKKYLCYDNNLENFGRIQVFNNDGAEFDSRVLIFGSSSSYSMFDYIVRIFKEIVFVHSAGNIDESVINIIKPSCIISQTNARFVVKPPVADYILQDVLIEKLSRRSLDDSSKLMVSSQKFVDACQLPYVFNLHEKLKLAFEGLYGISFR